MAGPSRSSSRHGLALGLTAAAACVAGGFVMGRSTGPVPPAAPSQPASPLPAPAATPSPAATVAPSLLHRGDLLEAIRPVVDSFAAGGSPSPELLALAGRRFELRLPFGCSGPLPPRAEGTGWRYDAASQTLRVTVLPDRWTPADWLNPADAAGVDRIAGFWLDRPWTSSETCPQGDATAPPEQSLGLAVFAAADAARIGAVAGEPLHAVAKLAPEALAASRGLGLRISGRVANAPGGGPVTCRDVAGVRRPTCLIAISPDTIAVELRDETLASWDIAPAAASDRAVPPAR